VNYFISLFLIPPLQVSKYLYFNIYLLKIDSPGLSFALYINFSLPKCFHLEEHRPRRISPAMIGFAAIQVLYL